MKRNSTELKVKYHGNKTEKSKGRKKNPNVLDLSKQGYGDDSPHRSMPSIDIHTPNGVIDMSNTGIPLWANGQLLQPYSGQHFIGAEQVKEIPAEQIPLAKTGGWLDNYQPGGPIIFRDQDTQDQYDPVSDVIYLSKDRGDQSRIHEMYHKQQRDEGRLRDAEFDPYGEARRKPNMMEDQAFVDYPYYNRRLIEQQDITNQFLQANPEFLFADPDAVYNMEINPAMYETPWTAEGEARASESPEGRAWLESQGIAPIYKKGGLPKHQVPPGEVAPFVTSNLNEYNRRKAAHADSANVHNLQNQYNAEYLSNFNTTAIPNNKSIDLQKILELAKSRATIDNAKRTVNELLSLKFPEPVGSMRVIDPSQKLYQARVSRMEGPRVKPGHAVSNKAANDNNLVDLVVSDDNTDYKKGSKQKVLNPSTIVTSDYVMRPPGTRSTLLDAIGIGSGDPGVITYGYPHKSVVHATIKPSSYLMFHQRVPNSEGSLESAGMFDPSSILYDANQSVNVTLPYFAMPVQEVIYEPKPQPSTDSSKPVPMKLMTPKGIKSIDVPESSPQLITQWDGPTAPATHFMDYENFQPFTAAGYPMIDVRSKKSSVVPKGYEKGSKQEEIYRKRYETGGSSGWLQKYQTKGPVKYVSDPNDPALKAFQDSSSLYNAYEFQKNNTIIRNYPQRMYDNVNLKSDSYKPIKNTNAEYKVLLEKKKKQEEQQQAAMGRGDYNHPSLKNPIDFSNLVSHSPIDLKEMKERESLSPSGSPSNYEQNRRIIDYYRSIGIPDRNINFYNSPDVYHPTIKPVAEYNDGQAISPVYKKPVQQVVLSRPDMKPMTPIGFSQYEPQLQQREGVTPQMLSGIEETIMMPSGVEISQKEFIKQYGQGAWDRATNKKMYSKQTGGSLPIAQIGIPGKFKKKLADPTYGYGVQWFNDWYTHPETQKRLEQSGLDQEDMRYAFENIGNTQFAQTYPEAMSIVRRDLNKVYDNPKRVNKFLGIIGEEILSTMPDVRGFALPVDESFGLVYTMPQSLRRKESTFPHELIHASTIDRDIANQIGANKAYITPKLKEFYPDLYKEAKKKGNKEAVNEMFQSVGAPDEYTMFREIYPYVQSLRYELGVKPGDVITDEMLNKYKNDYEENAKQFPQRHRSGDSALDRLLKMYSKPKLIQFMNTVAENKQPGMEMPMARTGGLPKYQVPSGQVLGAPSIKRQAQQFMSNQNAVGKSNPVNTGAVSDTTKRVVQPITQQAPKDASVNWRKDIVDPALSALSYAKYIPVPGAAAVGAAADLTALGLSAYDVYSDVSSGNTNYKTAANIGKIASKAISGSSNPYLKTTGKVLDYFNRGNQAYKTYDQATQGNMGSAILSGGKLLKRKGGPTNWLQQFQTKGEKLGLNNMNTAVAATTAVSKPLIVPTSVTLPLPEEFFMKDPRKIHPVTGKPINERRDLKKGTYSTDVVNTIAKQAKEHGLSKQEALDLMAISLQESLLGKTDDEVGHTDYGDPITGYVDRTKVFEPLSEEEVNQMSPIELNTRNMLMNYVYNTKILNKGRKPKSRAELLQLYNTPYPEEGLVNKNTEKQYHNDMGVGTNSFYGIDVTKQPLSMKSNPYGKTVQSLSDSVLGLDPTIQEILKRTYRKTGGALEKYQTRGAVKPFVTSNLDEYNRRKTAYADSLSLYKKTMDILNPKYYDDGEPSWYNFKGNRKETNDFMRKNNIDLDYEYYRTGKFPGKIQPIGTGEFGEGIRYPIYKKPVQEVVYEPLTFMQPKGLSNDTEINLASNPYPTKMVAPTADEIRMPSGQMMSRKAFIKQYGQGAWDRATNKKQMGGPLPKAQTGRNILYVDPDDPEGMARYKAAQDSAAAYNSPFQALKALETWQKNPTEENAEKYREARRATYEWAASPSWSKDERAKGFKSETKDTPDNTPDGNKDFINYYEKPVQQVVLRRPDVKPMTPIGFSEYESQLQQREGVTPQMLSGIEETIWMPSGVQISKKDFIKQYGEPSWDRATNKKEKGGSKLPPHLPEAYKTGGWLKEYQSTKDTGEVAQPARPISNLDRAIALKRKFEEQLAEAERQKFLTNKNQAAVSDQSQRTAGTPTREQFAKQKADQKRIAVEKDEKERMERQGVIYETPDPMRAQREAFGLAMGMPTAEAAYTGTTGTAPALWAPGIVAGYALSKSAPLNIGMGAQSLYELPDDFYKLAQDPSLGTAGNLVLDFLFARSGAKGARKMMKTVPVKKTGGWLKRFA